MNKQLQGLNTEFVFIRGALSKLEGEIADMEKSIIQQREKKHAVESLRECKSKLERERHHMTKENRAMRRKLHARNVELVSIRKAHKQLEAQRVEAENKLRKKVHRLEDLLKSERRQRAKENRTLSQQFHNRNVELESIRVDREKLKGQLVAAEKSVNQEQAEKKEMSESLRKLRILLKSEQDQRAEAEECRTQCEALLEQQTAHRLLGSGINIQGACATLPEIEAFIRQTLTITVSEWVEEGSQALYEFSKNSEWLIPQVLANLFILCKRQIYDSRQKYVIMFLGKVEGAVEDEVDAAAAHFMRDHLRRHYLTLFSASSAAGEKACRLMMDNLGGTISNGVGGGTGHDRATRTLLSSGLEVIASYYLRILASCAVQQPLVSQTSDCSHVQPIDKHLHSEPIDGDGDVTKGGTCMIIFPALTVKREGSGQAWDLVNKRFVLGPQEQALREVSGY